jgi:hypothetical protein
MPNGVGGGFDDEIGLTYLDVTPDGAKAQLTIDARHLQPHGIVVLEVGGLRAAMDKAFPELDLHWLHTEDGEDCVCVVTAARLKG